jgi:hypothetical protein
MPKRDWLHHDKAFVLTRWLPALLLLQALLLGLAWRAYPRYSPLDHDISFLGHPRLNPLGWLFWSLGMGVTGVMMWPVIGWTALRMRELTARQAPWQRRLVAIGTACSRGSCFGLIGLALIPQYPGLDPAHQLAGACAFGGMYVTMLFFWCVPLWSTSLGVAKLLLLTVCAYWGPVGWCATQGYRFFAFGEVGRKILVKNQSLLLRFSLWEWLLFVCGSTSMILLVLLLPEDKQAAKSAGQP